MNMINKYNFFINELVFNVFKNGPNSTLIGAKPFYNKRGIIIKNTTNVTYKVKRTLFFEHGL